MTIYEFIRSLFAEKKLECSLGVSLGYEFKVDPEKLRVDVSKWENRAFKCGGAA